MTEEGDEAAFYPPAIGSRVSALVAPGKWGAAVVERASGANSRLPFCLRYDASGSVEWVRFVSDNVLEAWRAPKARGRQGKAAAVQAPPPDATTEVLPYFVLPEDAKTKGRPTSEVVRMREAAEAAAKEYKQQQPEQQQHPLPQQQEELHQQQQEEQQQQGRPQPPPPQEQEKEQQHQEPQLDGGQGRRHKRRRLRPITTLAPAAGQDQQQQHEATVPSTAAHSSLDCDVHTANGMASSDSRQLAQGVVGAAKAEKALHRERPSTTVVGGKPAATPSARRAEDGQEVSTVAAASPGASRQRQEQQQDEQRSMRPAATSVPASASQEMQAAPALKQPDQAAPRQDASAAAASAVTQHAEAASAAEGGAAAVKSSDVAPPARRVAVTELGRGTFVPLATVSEDARQASPSDASQQDKQRHGRSAAAGSKRPAGQHREQGQSLPHQRPQDLERQQQGHGKEGEQQGQQQPERQVVRHRPASRLAEERPLASSQEPDAQLEQEHEGHAAPVPAPQPPSEADVACRRFAALLPGLSGSRESITSAATAAINAGQLGGCKEVVRCVLEHMRDEAVASRRVTYFYLLDAMLGHSRKVGSEGCGPDSVVGTLFPRTVGAALSQLVDLLGASLEAAQKMEKALVRTWLPAGKRGVEISLVQRALEMLRDRIAQHEAAWGGSAPPPATASGIVGGASGAMAGGGEPGQGPAGLLGSAANGARSSSTAVVAQLDLCDPAALRRLLRRTPMRAAPRITYVNLKDGTKIQLTHAWHPDAWPNYDALPLPRDAVKEQYSHQLAAAGVPAAAKTAAAEEESPWHASFVSKAVEPVWPAGQLPPWLGGRGGAAPGLDQQQQQHEHMAAAHLAQLAAAQHAQRALLQAQVARARGQSTSAAADVDEFDAGLFKEAAGGAGLSTATLQQQPHDTLLPDLLQPLGEAPPWQMGRGLGATPAPPLPDQPPLPEDDVYPAGEGGYGSEDEDFGPPPLPPHSPPRDEYELGVEGGTPPPLPPSDDMEEDEGPAPPPLPPHATTPATIARSGAQQQQQPQQHSAMPAALSATPGAYPGGWGGAGYGTPLSYASGGAQQAAAFLTQPGLPGMAAPHPLLPPGIGITPHIANPGAGMAQQQAQQQQHQMWMAQQAQQAHHAQHSQQQLQAQQAFLMRAAASQQQQQQQQQAAARQAGMMGGMTPPGALPPLQQQLFSPAMNPAMNPHVAQQQQQQQSAAMLGVPSAHAAQPPALPRTG